MDINNKVALVTGGASGLGQATVEKLVSKGAKVAMLGRTFSKVKNKSNQFTTCGNRPNR